MNSPLNAGVTFLVRLFAGAGKYRRGWLTACSPSLKAPALLLALLAAPICLAQPRPTFEVASIRPSDAPPNEGNWSAPGLGKFNAHNLTLARLIMLAYNMDSNQIDNKPPWLESDRFDIAAKPSGTVTLTREELRPRLQSLLEERFHLATHTEPASCPGTPSPSPGAAPNSNPPKAPNFPTSASTSPTGN